MNGLLKLSLGDLGRGLLVAVLTAVIQYLASITDLLTIDPKVLITTAIIAGLAYLAKNLATNNEGKILGRW